ncbi:MAG TPA: O-antigen ligase family protein [Caldilineaceae bacterium]|nr:O-antigen ligase family protein [Caldilineaceae bacterium]
MLSPLRLWLAWLRLSLLLAIGYGLVLLAGFQARAHREQDQGLASPLPASAAPAPPFLGITLYPEGLTAPGLERTLIGLAGAGFGWVRVRLGWETIEPAPGDLRWQEADRLLEAIERAGLTPVVVLDGSPAWARSPQDQLRPDAHLAPPADLNDYARFAGAVATRYGDRLRFYQLWDEPNIAPHWGARHISPVAYAQMVKAAAPTIRSVDADATILLAALAPTADRGHTAQDEVYFLNRVYAAGAAPYFDAVAIQPFGFGFTPQEPRQHLQTLNFRRAVLVRRAMLAAGDGATPIWLVRYGWNRALNSPWGSVEPHHQIRFATGALEIGYRHWPWVAAQGWAAHAPALPDSHPLAGFSLTPALADGFRHWAKTATMHPRQPIPTSREMIAARPLATAPLTVLPAPATTILPWGWLAAAALLWLWRTWATLRLLPWRAKPAWLHAAIWTALLVVYYMATWPPLIALCWVAAALLIAATPALGVGLALALLPFYFQHKEVQGVDRVWAIAPAYAALLCTLPALLIWAKQRPWIGSQRLRRRASVWPPATAGWMAIGWMAVGLLGAAGVWYWPAYGQGLLALVIAPLALFTLLRWWEPARAQPSRMAGALFAGGLFLTLAGLGDWLRGGGTVADELRRLVGPTFSPNHTALYLERTLFLGLGLALARQGWQRWGMLAACGLIALALALTGSRGALLLGAPAGVAALILLKPSIGNQLRRLGRGPLLIGLGVGIGLALLLAWAFGPRLLNSATVHERLAIWSVTLALWRDYLLFGVGPDGFTWRFPAYLPPNSPLDPDLRHPHNLWLELAAQGGLVALVWLAGLALLVANWSWRNRHGLAWPQVGLLAGLAAAVAHGQVDAFQALPDLAAWNWAALALLLSWPAQPKTAAPQDSGSWTSLADRTSSSY